MNNILIGLQTLVCLKSVYMETIYLQWYYWVFIFLFIVARVWCFKITVYNHMILSANLVHKMQTVHVERLKNTNIQNALNNCTHFQMQNIQIHMFIVYTIFKHLLKAYPGHKHTTSIMCYASS